MWLIYSLTVPIGTFYKNDTKYKTCGVFTISRIYRYMWRVFTYCFMLRKYLLLLVYDTYKKLQVYNNPHQSTYTYIKA